MKELDLLKKNWNKIENFPKVSEEKIYAMLHKNSSSAVKWIFIISLIEIIFWSGLNFFFNDDEFFKLLDSYHIKKQIVILTIINYIIILFFIYKFYYNYKKINTTDSVKELLKSILETRKTVKFYVWYNLGMIALSFIIVMISQIIYDPNISKLINKVNNNSHIGYILIIGVYLVVLAVFICLFILFYRLIYGFLLKRLKKNYQELEKIEY